MRESSSNSSAGTKKLFADNVLIDILRDLPDAVLMIDPEGGIFYANPSAEKLFGFVLNAKKAPEFSDILPESSPYRAAENFAALWRDAEETGHIGNFETQLLDKTGKIIEVNLVKTAIHDKDGNFTGISAIFGITGSGNIAD